MGPPDQAISPVDQLEALAKRMSERGAAMLNVAEAARPLYASLDDTQKRLFGLLGGEMLLMGHGHHHRGMGPMGAMGKGMMGGEMGMMSREGMDMGMMGGQKGMMGRGGMGMMGREPGGMNMMGRQSDDDEDNSDDQ